MLNSQESDAVGKCKVATSWAWKWSVQTKPSKRLNRSTKVVLVNKFQGWFNMTQKPTKGFIWFSEKCWKDSAQAPPTHTHPKSCPNLQKGGYAQRCYYRCQLAWDYPSLSWHPRVIICSTSFHSHKHPSLDNKFYSHLRYERMAIKIKMNTETKYTVWEGCSF